MSQMSLKCPLNLKITYVLFLSHFSPDFPKNNVPERFAILPQKSSLKMAKFGHFESKL